MPQQDRFDKAYYDRYYANPATRVEEARDVRRRGNLVTGYIEYLQLPIRRVLDIGCGLGRWQRILKRRFPDADYHGVEFSEYLCRRYGWEQSSVVDFRSRHRYDLVICQEVLPYLPAPQAKLAIANLDKHCRGVLYLQAVTREDWNQHCDQEFTDGDIYLRGAAWYRRELKRYFTNLGAGLFLSNKAETIVYELEKVVC